MIIQEGRTSSQPDHKMEARLEEWLQQFDLWAASADRSDNGWEGYFPHWPELIQEAEQVMAGEHQSERGRLLLGRCWALSEEDESCADWARNHLHESHVQEAVRLLTDDNDPSTRWQAYDVLGNLLILEDGARASLENGLTDEDAYVRRRAFLALMRHSEIDAEAYIVQMLADTDIFNQSAARSAAVQVILKEPQTATSSKL